MKYILGKKIGMSQIWKGETVIPVTLIEAGPVTVVQKRSQEKDGYVAVQVGFGSKKHVTRQLSGHMKDLGKFRYLREFRAPEAGDSADGEFPDVGGIIDVSIFEAGDKVKVSGLTKGRGFQGVVKRHNFAGGPASHGQKHSLRAPGSIGSQAPQRVPPGKKMGGHMGTNRVSIKNLKVVDIDKDKNLLYIKGAVPGNRGELLEIVG